MTLSWVNVLQALVATLSLLLGYYLFSTRRCQALAYYFAVLCVHNLLAMTSELQPWDRLNDFSNTFRFLYAPLFYFIVRELLYQDFRYTPAHAWHLLPFVLAEIGISLSLQLTDPALLISIITNAAAVSIVVYLSASYLALYRFTTIIDNTRSSGLPAGVKWLERVLHLYTLLIVFEVARQLLGLVIPAAIYDNLHMLFVSIIFVCLTALVYQGLKSPMLVPAINREEAAISRQVTRDDRSQRHHDPAQLARLNNYMATEKPYLSPTLSVKELAEAIGIPGRALSELINDQFQCNFSEYINKARVIESQRLMALPEWQEHSLLDLGLAAGFNSKTSFNVMFKRYTGQTPSDYRAHLLATQPR